jgi:aminoglycoside phosphotransferase (APT) family kinase protein
VVWKDPAVRVPRLPEELDADGLSALLQRRHPGTRVTDVEITDVHEVTNTHVRIDLEYAVPTDLPRTMFVKMVPRDPARREQIARTDMGRREVRFYDDLAPHLGFRVPDVHGTAYDPDDGAFVLVMEDLIASGCSVSDGTVGVSADAAAVALGELTVLHARYEDPRRRAAEVPWIPTPTRGSPYAVHMLADALAHHRDRLSADFAAIAAIYVADRDALQDVWHGDHDTVIHGDPHLGNLFDDQGRAGFLDWGIIHVGSAMRDVSYFLTMAMDPAERRTHERDLLRGYLDARVAAGASEWGFADAWEAHRRHAAYTVVASCQIVTFPAGISERRRVFSEAFLARAEAAVADLDALDALRTALAS